MSECLNSFNSTAMLKLVTFCITLYRSHAITSNTNQASDKSYPEMRGQRGIDNCCGLYIRILPDNPIENERLFIHLIVN